MEINDKDFLEIKTLVASMMDFICDFYEGNYGKNDKECIEAMRVLFSKLAPFWGMTMVNILRINPRKTEFVNNRENKKRK